MGHRVLIVGSVAFDDITTPIKKVERCLGGAAIYGSVAASLFAPVDIIGVAGEDFPDEHIDLLTGRGINTEGLERIAGGKTFHWGGEYELNMNDRKTHFTDLGVFGDFDPKVPESCRDNEFVFLANIDPEIQIKALDQMTKPKMVVLDSMDLWINIKREALLEVIKRSDVTMFNESEAQQLFETHSLPQAADRLLALGVKCAVIKQGSYGAQLYTAEGSFSVPALPIREVIDPTGAGDTFAGGMIGYLAAQEAVSDMAFRQAMLVGTACASHVVEDFSVNRTAKMSKDDIRGRYDALLEMLRCEPMVFA